MSQRILFLPVSGGPGVGEYFRCLTLAEQLRAVSADVNIRFMVSRRAKFANDVPFPHTLIERSPTYHTPEVIQEIKAFQPDVVVFDSAGRTQQIKAAKRSGAKVLFVSSRDSTRRKGMRLKWLRMLDAHWHIRPQFISGPMTWLETFKLKLVKTDWQQFDGLFPEPDESAATGSVAESAAGYVLFAAGGGGKRGDGPQAPEVFADAAKQVAASTDKRCVVVMGPNYAGELLADEQLQMIKALPIQQFINLLAQAEVAVINGGTLLIQALANQVLSIAVPVGADQPPRIAACAEQGMVQAAELDADDIAQQTLQLVDDESAQARLLQAIQTHEIRNGLPIAQTQLLDWLRL